MRLNGGIGRPQVQIFMDGVPIGTPGVYAPAAFPQISQPLILGCKANGYTTVSPKRYSFITPDKEHTTSTSASDYRANAPQPRPSRSPRFRRLGF
jgi:hypothetical protein